MMMIDAFSKYNKYVRNVCYVINSIINAYCLLIAVSDATTNAVAVAVVRIN